MPKKSRREKMLADIRRRVRTQRILSVPVTASPIEEHASSYQFTSPDSSKRQETRSNAETLELTAIKKDLTKTIILAAVAIAAELALYWFGKGRI